MTMTNKLNLTKNNKTQFKNKNLTVAEIFY